MRVIAGPRVDLSEGTLGGIVARGLSGPDGECLSLRQVGVNNLSRQITQAEVAWLRGALRGDNVATATGEAGVVGYVCRGVAAIDALAFGDAASAGAGRPGAAGAVVAVTDHVNLAWRSPLEGRNDDAVGPRFPSMTGIYAHELVLERLGAAGGIIVTPGVVAGVADDESLNAYEGETVRALQYPALSSELVPVAIVAAHMGLRLAAAVLTTEGRTQGETVSGRS